MRRLEQSRRYTPIARLYAAATGFTVLSFFVPTVSVEGFDGQYDDISLAQVLSRGHDLSLFLFAVVGGLLAALVVGAAKTGPSRAVPVWLLLLAGTIVPMLPARPGFSSRPSEPTGAGAAAVALATLIAALAAVHLRVAANDPRSRRPSRP